TGARRQHQDRDLAVAAQSPRDLKAIESRQPEIEHHQIRMHALEIGERLPAVGREVTLEAGGLEVLDHHVGDPAIVFDHQDALLHGTFSIGPARASPPSTYREGVAERWQECPFPRRRLPENTIAPSNSCHTSDATLQVRSGGAIDAARR